PARRGFHAALGNIEYREDDAAAVEIVASARVPLPRYAEQVGIELRGIFEVRDLNGDAEDLRGCRVHLHSRHWLSAARLLFARAGGVRSASAVVDFGPDELQRW